MSNLRIGSALVPNTPNGERGYEIVSVDVLTVGDTEYVRGFAVGSKTTIHVTGNGDGKLHGQTTVPVNFLGITLAVIPVGKTFGVARLGK